MKNILISSLVLSVLFTIGVACAAETTLAYENLEFAETREIGKEYLVGASGIRGSLQDDHILVTFVESGSAADGQIRVGDLLTSFQYYGNRPDFGATVKLRLFRLGRDWNYRLTVHVERHSSRDGKKNKRVVHLQLPPRYGLQHHFGPTGFFAKLHADHLEVDHIDEGSPSDGMLKVGDRIVRVGGRDIGHDVFKVFTREIDKAESKKGKGQLALTIMRPGLDGAVDEKRDVVLALKVLGAYKPKSPFKGEKADALISQIADAMIRDKAYGRLNIGLLGLLATGEKKYIDHVGAVLKQSTFAAPGVVVPIDGTVQTWYMSYRTLVMCEYFLLTKDEGVLPAIRSHAISIAQGQDAAGLWNHRFAHLKNNNGKLHGRLNGYGALNQTSMTQWMAMIMAEKCGVEHAEVRQAIEKTHTQFKPYVGRGALPYGNHPAKEEVFNNNGTSASAAVAFSLIGDTEGARFFSLMTAAGHNNILTGHTGPFFNVMWSEMGANVAGPDVAAAFNNELHWLRTIARTWNGRCVSIVSWGSKPGNEDIGSTGSELLNACVGRRAIYITGKDADQELWLKGRAAKDAVTAWQFDRLSSTALLKTLGSPLPPVRFHAAEALALTEAEVADKVLALLRNGRRDERIGAMHAIRCMKIETAVDDLMQVIRTEEEELWLRIVACKTLAALSTGNVRSDDLLRLITIDRPKDHFAELDMALGQVVVKMKVNPYDGTLDKDTFYKAITELLNHNHVHAREAGMLLLREMPIEDFYRVADLMLYIVEDKDRGTYTSYHYDGHRQAALEIMYGLGVEESIDLTIDTIVENVGRLGLRRRGRTALMNEFGGEAQHIIPKIKDVLGKDADPIVEKIETSTTTRKMISFEDAKNAGK